MTHIKWKGWMTDVAVVLFALVCAAIAACILCSCTAKQPEKPVYAMSLDISHKAEPKEPK